MNPGYVPDCRASLADKRYCDLKMGHEGDHAPCTAKGHGPTCEGGGVHIRARCPTGCPQFQDGSWMARPFCVQRGTEHPGLRGKRRPTYGIAEATTDWLEASFAANRRPR